LNELLDFFFGTTQRTKRTAIGILVGLLFFSPSLREAIFVQIRTTLELALQLVILAALVAVIFRSAVWRPKKKKTDRH